MWACNYDFARDNSHSSDLNVVSFCEDNILMRFFLFISTEIELFIYTREIAPTPLPLLTPVWVTLAAGMPYQAGDRNKEREE